jgi:hypothetical protein
MSIFGEITATGIGSIMSGVGGLAKDIRQAITGELPAEKQVEIEMKLSELEAQAMNAQAMINLEEAKSEKFWVAGWRPFIGWCGGFGLAYAGVLEPFMRFISKVAFNYTGEFPTIDTTLTSQVVIAMLGIGMMRSFDKKQAPSPAGKE